MCIQVNIREHSGPELFQLPNVTVFVYGDKKAGGHRLHGFVVAQLSQQGGARGQTRALAHVALFAYKGG